ncbi:hypothetical protein AVEN_13322-1 [Araneus ventricosus]|uniref:Uncharacterized protein n=1 Tax=Araneus ventricosus TaxID=182803 RepID=A0A4Y2HE31_ARAVE|nr:hypothetical protein AVEN_13322-1 [Araneus ventricosus]
MFIKVDEFPWGFVKTEPKPNNGERETSEEIKSQESEGHPGMGGRKKKEQHTFSLAPKAASNAAQATSKLNVGKHWSSEASSSERILMLARRSFPSRGSTTILPATIRTE